MTSGAPHAVFYDEVADQRVVDQMRDSFGDGFHVEALPFDEPGAELQLAEHAEFILAGWRAVPASTIENASNLVGIHKLGSGIEKIDVEAARRCEVTVTSAVGQNSAQVAEHVILLMLAVLRQLGLCESSLRRGQWLKNELRPVLRSLEGRRVGIVGFGHIGEALAHRLRSFGCRVLYHDVRRRKRDEETALGVAYRNLEELFSECELISLHLPRLPETVGLIDAELLARCRDDAVLINTARGDIVDYEALTRALKEQRLAGAGLDVFPEEPVRRDDELFGLENVVVTPHVAGTSRDALPRMATNARNIFEHLLRGERPPQAAGQIINLGKGIR